MAKKRPSISATSQRKVQGAVQQEAQPTKPAEQDESGPQHQPAVFGKRAGVAYTQLSAIIPKDPKARFVCMDARDINTDAQELLEAYIESR